MFGRRWNSGKIKIKLLLYPVCSLKQWDNDDNFISLCLWQFSLSYFPKFENNLNGGPNWKFPFNLYPFLSHDYWWNNGQLWFSLPFHPNQIMENHNFLSLFLSSFSSSFIFYNKQRATSWLLFSLQKKKEKRSQNLQKYSINRLI